MKFRLSPKIWTGFNPSEHKNYLDSLSDDGLAKFRYEFIPYKNVFILDIDVPMPRKFISKISERYYFSPLD